MPRPVLRELTELLVSENAILVHFSGSRADLPPEHQYPFNLRYAVNNPNENSFSSVRPGDDAQKHWGSFGIIGLPRGLAGITGIGPNDWGTWRLESGTVCVPERNASVETCKAILADNSNEYDEWVLNAYSVHGLFAFSDEHLSYGFPPNPRQFMNDLPGLRIFSAIQKQFVEILENGETRPVTVENIYGINKFDNDGVG
jgi:hypothetical protein